MTTVDHVVLTRFNLPTSGVEGLMRAREHWLQDRVALFERYTVPSVARQTRPVVWLVYFDPESPAWLIDRLKPLVEAGHFHPVYRDAVTTQDLVADVRDAVPDHGDFLLTSNLDNDDGLADDFSERLRQVDTPHDQVVVYLAKGLIKSPEGVYLRTDRRNAFVSVRERWDAPVTSWSEYHNEFPRVMPCVEVDGAPAWLQVVHGANVSNRVRGRLVAPHPYAKAFGEALDDARVPSRGQELTDRLIGHPTRAARDGARAFVRVAGLRLLGKDRYQQAKLKLSALRHG